MNSRVLQLETSKICNVKCSFCYKSDKNYKNSNINEPFMTLSEIKKYFADNISWQKVILFNNGEFFVNPEWKQIFEFVVNQISNYSENCEILINTNTILLDNDSADFIINTVKNSKMILRLTFSINAYSKEVYQNLISENLRDRVYENAENFIIKAINYENICANPQIIVMKENFNEIEDFVNCWANFFEKNNVKYSVCEDTYSDLNTRFNIFIRRFNTASFIEADLFEKSVCMLEKNYDVKVNKTLKYEKNENYFKRDVCKFVYENGVYSGSKHILCCRDINQKLIFPGISEQDNILREFFISNHLTGNFENMSPCLLCSNYEIADKNTVESNFLTKQNEIIYKNRMEKGTGFDFYKIIFDNDSKEFAEGFLKQHDFFVLCNDKLKENFIFKGNFKQGKIHSSDICAGWKMEPVFENNKMYAGCSKFRFEIKDFDNYQKNLKQGDFSQIPPQCLICQEKYVYNKLTDRLNISGEHSFYSPVTPSNRKYEILKQIENFTEKNEFEEVRKILSKENRIYFYFKFIDYSNSKKLTDEAEVLNIIEDTDNYFLYNYMVEKKEKDFEKCFVYIIENFNILPGVNNILRIFDFYFENKFKSEIIKNLCEKILQIIKNPEKDFQNQHEYNFIAKQNYFITEMTKKLEYRAVWFVENDYWDKFLNIFPLIQNKDEILEAVNFNLLNKLKQRKYHSVLMILKKLKNIDLKLQNTIELIYKTDFRYYNERFIKLLLWLGIFTSETDTGIYLTYSYYMKVEKFKTALKYFKKIKSPLDKFSKKDYINTEIYLYEKTGNTSKALALKIKSKFKQGID